MTRNTGIAAKLALLVLGTALLVLAAVLAYNYQVSRDIIVREAERNVRNLGRKTVHQFGQVLVPIERTVQNMAIALEDANLTRDDIIAMNRRILENNPDIFGMAIAFEPFALGKDHLYFSPYWYRSQGRTAFTMLGGPDYRYFYMDWYQVPKELDHPAWTEPYFDEGGGGVIMTTYSVPFYRTHNGKRVFAGVCTADISLEWLRRNVSDIRLYENGYAVVLSKHGTYVYHPMERLVMNHTIFSLAIERNDPSIRAIGKAMINGETGFVARKSVKDDRDSFLYYTPLPIGGWSLGILFARDDVLAGVQELTRDMLLIGLAGFLLLAAAVIWIARSITSPLRDLSGAALEIASGNLELQLPEIKSRDEVGDLADSFHIMKRDLRAYIDNLTNTTAAKERIESELRIAREIQMGILPKLFPAFPDRPEFDVFASIEPAKEVGGDLYDFFFVDERHFCFLVGDVSGKGVPAAFFMAVTKTLLKVVSERGLDPGEILSKVNSDLSEENESCMFVTLFLAIMNIETGETRYASAGHNPPLLVPCHGDPEWIPPSREPVAGVMQGMEYTTNVMTLRPGDTLFVYTDGVTEAMNPKRELFSEQRLMDLASSAEGMNASGLIGQVDAAIKEFAEGAEQSDDITMLAMQYCGACPDKE